jgi:Pan3 Pseudokinase domain
VIVAHMYVMSCPALFYSVFLITPLIRHRDRYVLKLFRDYMFHQALSDGAPVLDAGESSMFMLMFIVRNGGGTNTSDGVYCVCIQPTSHPPIGLRGTLTIAITAPVMLHHYNTLIIILLITSSHCPSVHRLSSS